MRMTVYRVEGALVAALASLAVAWSCSSPRTAGTCADGHAVDCDGTADTASRSLDSADEIPDATDRAPNVPDPSPDGPSETADATANVADHTPAAPDGTPDAAAEHPDLAAADASADHPATDAGDPAEHPGNDANVDSNNNAQPGDGGTLQVAGALAKLIADPNGNLVYGLVMGNPSALAVFDDMSKTEVHRIKLPGVATDFDVSPDGRWLVAALDTHHALAVVDKATWTAATVLVTADPDRVQVGNSGVAYYVTLDQWTRIYKVDLTVPNPIDTGVCGNLYQPDIQLSGDGQRLFIGESGTTGGVLFDVDLTAGCSITDRSTWNGGSGFAVLTRWLYLGPHEKHIYYSDHQLDTNKLAFMKGSSGQVFAENKAGTLAVSQAGLVDAELLKVISPFPTLASAATLAAGDAEVWWYDAASSTLHFESVAERIGSWTLGTREQAPQDLLRYRFTRIVADPARDRLYGLDPDAQAVVSIDRTTLQPVGTVVVGSAPSDIDVDPTGAFLYVGHEQTQAVAQIRLDTFALSKFIVTFRDSYDIAVLGAHRLATINVDQYVSATLIDVETGTTLEDYGPGGYKGAIAGTADGRTLFAGESAIVDGVIGRYDVSTDKFVSTAMSNPNPGFLDPLRSVVVTPDGTGVYYAGYLLDGATLRTLRYAQSDTILTVTSDNRLALSSSGVYRVSDGAALGPLSPSGTVQAASPDGHTLYVATAQGIAAIDLTGY